MRDQYTCQYCGLKTRDLTLDHVIPRHRGGPHTWDNLVTACRSCNHRKGGKALEEGSKPWQLAALFVRSFRSLDAIVGSDDTAARAWMRGANAALGGVPLELMREPAGLARTVDYLDAARARL